MEIQNSEQFAKNIKLKNNEKIILFETGDYVGFSITKEYNTLKVLRNGGDNDLYCLLRIGYKTNEIKSKKKLYIDCSIQSKFQRDYNGKLFGDRDNKEYPIQELYENFKNQRIPFNLKTSDKSEFYYEVNTNKFYEKNNEIKLRELIDNVFQSHENSSSLLNQIIYKYPSIFLTYAFDWVVIKGFYEGIYKYIINGPKIKDEDFIAINMYYGNSIKPILENQIESNENKSTIKKDTRNFEISLPLFGGKININKRGLWIGIIVLGLLGIQFYSNQNCNNYIINVLQFYKDNEIILGTLFIIWIGIFHIVFDLILPKLILSIINILIKFRKIILDSFYYKGFDYDTGNNPYK